MTDSESVAVSSRKKRDVRKDKAEMLILPRSSSLPVLRQKRHTNLLWKG